MLEYCFCLELTDREYSFVILCVFPAFYCYTQIAMTGSSVLIRQSTFKKRVQSGHRKSLNKRFNLLLVSTSVCRHDTLHKPQDIAKTAGIRTAALNCVHLPCTAVHDWSTLFQIFLRKEFCIFLPKATRTCIVKWQHKLKSSKVYSHLIPWRKSLLSQFATSSTRLTDALAKIHYMQKPISMFFATKLNENILRKSFVYSKLHQFIFAIIDLV